MMAQKLANRHATGTVRCLPARAGARRSRMPMTARAEGRVVREYREDDDKIVSAPAAKKPEGEALYAKDAKIPQQQGLSKEYKQRLKQEYIGLGGAEGQAMSQNWFVVVIATVGTLVIMCKAIGAI